MTRRGGVRGATTVATDSGAAAAAAAAASADFETSDDEPAVSKTKKTGGLPNITWEPRKPVSLGTMLRTAAA